MPAAAVARRTPPIAGMSGTSLGASGETVGVMRSLGRKENRRARGPATMTPIGRRLSILLLCAGRACACRACARRAAGRGRGGGGARSRSVGPLDLGAVAQLGDEIGLCLAHHVGLELRLHLIEGWNLALALILNLDDVPAELGLYRVGDLALVELERHLGEFRHHLVLGEVAEVAALRGARILRLLLRQGGKVGALLELVGDRLGVRLGLDK